MKTSANALVFCVERAGAKPASAHERSSKKARMNAVHRVFIGFQASSPGMRRFEVPPRQ
jgi:hypothetical protein